VKKDNSDNMRKRLTSRQAAIIQLLSKSAPEPVTLASISQKLEVSSRTVMRELDKVEQWLDENDFKFLRKPGVGLAILEEPSKPQPAALRERKTGGSLHCGEG
jgi:mannitol operon transcriptional antiterminator